MGNHGDKEYLVIWDKFIISSLSCVQQLSYVLCYLSGVI